MKIRLVLGGSVAALSVCAGLLTAVPAPDATAIVPAGSASSSTGVDRAELQSAMDGVHRAGIPGVYAEVRDAGRTWRGASGVADVTTGRPVRADMRQRVGSITKIGGEGRDLVDVGGTRPR
ncbi:serine hydrolase [Streptomyces vilmorinianum]|uniref:serine hydrolase n=1 Tax=Streptomyces vilmorinianum TaxID=3051092 RepID=UPI0032E7FFDD